MSRRAAAPLAVLAVACAAFVATTVLPAPPAGATLTPPSPSSGTAGAGETTRTDFEVQPISSISACVSTSGTPPRTHPVLSPASSVCGDSDRGLALIISVDKTAAPGTYPITITEFEEGNPSHRIDSKTFTLVIPAPASTTSSSTTTTTAPPPTTVPVAVVTTEATTTTVATTTTSEPPTTTSTTFLVSGGPKHRGSALPWVVLGVVALAAVGAAVLRLRATNRQAATGGAATGGAATLVATPAAGAIDAPAVPLTTMPASELPAGLVTPTDSVVVPWGRSLPLRAGTVGTDFPAEFRWRVEDVQAADSGRWVAWPAGRAAGGLRVRRATSAGRESDGAQALLLHPYLPATGDVALVKLCVDVTDGKRTTTFPAWFRCERTADWEVTVTTVHAPSAPAELPPLPAALPGRTIGGTGPLAPPVRVDAPPGPWSAGEQLLLRAEWEPDAAHGRALTCEWTASAGRFPAGNDSNTVVFEVPLPVNGARGPAHNEVEVGLAVTDLITGETRVVRTVVAVVEHAVVLVSDLLGGGLERDGTPVWPPPGNDPLAAARATASALRLSPTDAPLRAVASGGHQRARDVLHAAGHTVTDAAYDWRLAPSAAADAIGAAVTMALATSGAGSLDDAVATASSATVIAHGTGGLALHDWLREVTARAVVDDAVFVGTPHHGMPAAFRWLRFGGHFGRTAMSQLGDAVDAVAAAAGADVVASWPILAFALPGSPWFQNVGPLLHDRQFGGGWLSDAFVTYTTPPGQLPTSVPIQDALRGIDAPHADATPVRMHTVVGEGVPTECLYSYGSVDTVVDALADPLIATMSGALEGSPEVRSLAAGPESLVVTLLDGDGVVPAVSATGGLDALPWRDECRVRNVAHEELLDDTHVLGYLVYVIEHLGAT